MTTTLEALQATLAGEHAAVWTFEVLGARLSRSAEPELAALIDQSYLTHRARRDLLVAAVRDLGVQPAAAAVAYELPSAAVTARQVQAAAGTVEARCLAVYADLVAGAGGEQRRWAVGALTQSAVHELGFRDRPVAFPGIAELAGP